MTLTTQEYSYTYVTDQHWMNTSIARGIFSNVMTNEPKATEPRWWQIRFSTDLPATHDNVLLSLYIKDTTDNSSTQANTTYTITHAYVIYTGPQLSGMHLYAYQPAAAVHFLMTASCYIWAGSSPCPIICHRNSVTCIMVQCPCNLCFNNNYNIIFMWYVHKPFI